MTENPEWVKIWDELWADFQCRRADKRHVHALVVCELVPDTPDFEFVPAEDVTAGSSPP